VDAARAYSLTPEFQADRKRRSRVERFIAGLVRYNGARRARRRGLDQADFQAKMNATAFNLKRWMRLLKIPRQQPATT
jgi:IS5 family transposase